MQNNTKLITFVITILICIGLAAGGILYFENIRTNGERIILETEPVDPRSLMRGDYVILSYKIANISANELEMISPGPEAKTLTIYTTLELDEDGRVIRHAHQRNRPETGIYLRGTVFDQGQAERVKYGIEQYFVPEGKGWTIERVGRQWGEDPESSLEASIAVESGNAQILELLINGEPVDFKGIESENPFD